MRISLIELNETLQKNAQLSGLLQNKQHTLRIDPKKMSSVNSLDILLIKPIINLCHLRHLLTTRPYLSAAPTQVLYQRPRI